MENESKKLACKEQNISTMETISWVAAAIGMGLTFFSLFGNDSSGNKGRINPKLGMTVAAASAASLSLTYNEKTKLLARLDLVKDRYNRLEAVYIELTEIRAKLTEYENWINDK